MSGLSHGSESTRQQNGGSLDFDLIRRACFDPGKFVAREFTDHGDSYPGIEYEPLHVWQARAVVVALAGDR